MAVPRTTLRPSSVLGFSMERTNEFVKCTVERWNADNLHRAAAPAQAAFVSGLPHPMQVPAFYKIPSARDARKLHTVIIYPPTPADGTRPSRAECDCPGYRFRRNCAHTDAARTLHDSGLGGLDPATFGASIIRDA